MITDCQLQGEIQALATVLVYDNTLGLEYSEEVELDNVAFEGSYHHTPGTSEHPPELDMRIKTLMSRDELLTIILRWFHEWPTLTILDDGWGSLEENVTERVLEEPESYG